MLTDIKEHSPDNRMQCRFPTNLKGTSPIVERRSISKTTTLMVRQSNGVKYRLQVSGEQRSVHYLVKKRG